MNPSCFVRLLLRIIFSLKPRHSNLVHHQWDFSIASVSALPGINLQAQVGMLLGYLHTPLSFRRQFKQRLHLYAIFIEKKNLQVPGLHEQREMATEDVNCWAGSSHRGLICVS